MIINLVDFDKSAADVNVFIKKGVDPSSEQRWKIYSSTDSVITIEGTVDDLSECVEIVLTNNRKDKTIFHHPV